VASELQRCHVLDVRVGSWMTRVSFVVLCTLLSALVLVMYRVASFDSNIFPLTLGTVMVLFKCFQDAGETSVDYTSIVNRKFRWCCAFLYQLCRMPVQ
jgi:hypothetical protein